MDTSVCTLLYNHLIPHLGQFCLKKRQHVSLPRESQNATMNQSQPQREWTFVTASTPAQFQGPSTQFLVKSAAKRNYIRSRDRRPRHPPRSIAPLPRNHITDETTRLETKSYRSTHTPVRRDLAAPSAPSLDTLEEPEQEPETNNVKNLVSDEHTYEIVQIHYGAGSSSSVTSASFVPDWMLGTHVWRTEDAMAAFNLPQKYHAYYSDVVNHCMFPSQCFFHPA
jgi:hypothetical protein